MPLPSASPRNPLRWLLGLALQVEVAADVASHDRALLEEVLGLHPCGIGKAPRVPSRSARVVGLSHWAKEGWRGRLRPHPPPRGASCPNLLVAADTQYETNNLQDSTLAWTCQCIRTAK